MRHCALTLTLPILTLLAAGCREPDPAQRTTAPPPGTTLRILVVGDPALGESIGYLHGEWEAQSGVGFAVTAVEESDFIAGEVPDADLVIGPSHLLGPACQAGWVLPLPEEVVANNQADWSDIFPQIRGEAAWGRQAYGVPFGSPVPVLYYRPDLLQRAGRKTPVTWAEYQKTAAALAAGVPAAAAVEPLAEGWGGITLLARAASYASHRDNLSTLFSISTMEPLIAGPPFVRALEELAASADPKSLAMDPAAVREAFWRGEAAMAITWPSAADASLAELRPEFAAGVVELPGSQDVFDVGDGAWEKRPKEDDGRVPLLAAAGRLGMVTTASQWPATAWQLLLWLSDEKWSATISTASPYTTLFRGAHLEQVSGWVERPMRDGGALDYAEAAARTMQRREHLLVPRIAGRRDYLAALDRAVHAAVGGEKAPQEALDEAAAAWREVTERLGVDSQKAAYRASLGLD